MMPTRAWPVSVAIAVPIAIAVAALGGCGQSRSEPPPAPPTPPGEAWLTPEQVASKLTLAEVTEREVAASISTSGRVTFDDLRVTHVYSPVTGRITRILAEPGQRVKRGAPLAVIQSPDVGSALSDQVKAHADLVAAEHDYLRKRDLYEAHAASQSDFESAQDNFGKAKAEMERTAQKARLLSRGSLNRVTQEISLKAPIDGVVIARAANPGLEVQGQYSGGTAVELFTIGELDRVWVLADVFEMDLARVKKGAPVTVHVVAYPNREFKGTVEYIAGALDPTTRAARVRCAIANPGGELKPEMYATVSITTTGRRAIAVPRSALLRVGDGMNVFVRKGSAPNGQIVFERVPVAVDEEDEDEAGVPVTHGLTPGQTVVVKGGIELLGMI